VENDRQSSHADARRRADPAQQGRSGFVLVGDVRLHYIDRGESTSPPLLLLHGGSAHAHWWDFFAGGFLDRYRVIAPDLRGHGDSDWSSDLRYGLDVHVQDVLALADHFELRELALVGHSFGALVAVAAAAELGHRVRSLVLVDSRIRVTERAARFMDALRKLPHPVYRSAADAVARFRLLPSDHSSSPEVLAHVARHAIRQVDGGTWTLKFDRRAMVNTNPVDLSAALGGVACPVLVVRGSNSTIMSHAALEEFSAAAPHASIVEIEGAHHHVMLDRPELLASAVRSFLDAEWPSVS
jgi:pimeloyl-ACP methyl ester carboxylesterase